MQNPIILPLRLKLTVKVALPKKVETAHGEMPGYKLAEELPPSAPISLRQYQVPDRQRRPGEPEVYNLVHALKVFAANVIGSRKLRDIMLSKLRVGSTFAVPGGITYLVLFKRDRYHFFSRHFPQVPEKGHGIIANIKLVHWCAVEGFRMAAVFPDGNCYWIDGREFWDYYEKYGTEHPSLPEEIATPFGSWKFLFGPPKAATTPAP